MFTADTVMFDDRKRIRLYFPLVSVLIPLVYGSYIYIRSAIPGISGKAKVVYPYFFMNIKTFGVENVVKWLAVMLFVYIVAGYALYALETLISVFCGAVIKKRSH